MFSNVTVLYFEYFQVCATLYTNTVSDGRSAYVALSNQKYREESLLPFCFYLMKLWNVKYPHGRRTRTKKDLKLHNVIDSEDEDEKDWIMNGGHNWKDSLRDSDKSEADEQEQEAGQKYPNRVEGQVYIILEPTEKIKDKRIIWYEGIESEAGHDSLAQRNIQIGTTDEFSL